MKTLAFSAFALCLAAGSARATTTYSYTDTSTYYEETQTFSPGLALSTTVSSYDQDWNFTGQPGFTSPYLAVQSIVITEVFAGVAGGSTASTTLTAYDTTLPNGESATYIVYDDRTLTNPTDTVTVTDDVPSPVTLADISNGGTLGEFDTRVSRYNAGSFTLDSMSVTINYTTPEPATFMLMGLGLAAVGLFARRRARA
jgi:hypothetical protein